MKPSKECYKPTYHDFIVEFAPEEFGSSLRTRRVFDEGDILTSLEGLSRGPKAYTSVQCGPGPNDHVELNSDLVYINHSCEPNVAFDLSSPDPSKWEIRALKRIETGTALTFFYPSTEWDMDQAFECKCETPSCLGRIQGAAYLSEQQVLSRGFTNPWILDLFRGRERLNADRQKSAKDGNYCSSCGYGFSLGEDLEKCGCKPASLPVI